MLQMWESLRESHNAWLKTAAALATFCVIATLLLAIKALASAGSLQTRIDRVVQYDTGQVRRDTTQSRYVPWGAIYALNPKDPRIKQKKRPK